MGTYDLFRNIAQANLTSKERSVSQIQYDIASDFYDSPSYQSVTINEDTRDVQIVDESAINKKPNKKRMLALPNETFNIGEVVVWNSENWLITNLDSDIGVQTRGIIDRCNNILSFYNNHTPYILPCIISAVGNSLGMSVDETKYITDISDVIMVKVPDNSTSRLIEIDDIFKIGKRNYKVTNDSDIIENGLLIFKMQVTLEEVVIPIYSYAIEILNGIEQTIRSGETLTLNVQVEDNGIVVTPTPALLYETSDSTVCTVNNSGIVLVTAISGNAIITVKLVSDNTIMNTIKIIATSESQINYNYTLIGNLQPDTQIFYNQTRSFTATKYDSLNNIIPTQFLFQVVGNTPLDKYLLTVLNNIQCTVKALGYPYTITLRAIDINSNQYIDKPITLKSLI